MATQGAFPQDSSLLLSVEARRDDRNCSSGRVRTKGQVSWPSYPCTIPGLASLKNAEYSEVSLARSGGLDEICIPVSMLQPLIWAACYLSQDRSILELCTSLRQAPLSLNITPSMPCPTLFCCGLWWMHLGVGSSRYSASVLSPVATRNWACPIWCSWVLKPACKDNARRMCCQPPGCLLQQLLVPS